MDLIKPYVSKRKIALFKDETSTFKECHGNASLFKTHYRHLYSNNYIYDIKNPDIRCYTNYKAQITSIKWNKKFDHLCLASSLDGSLGVWNVKESLEVQNCIFYKGISKASWSNDCRDIISTSYDKKLNIIDPEIGLIKLSYEYNHYLTTLAPLPINSNFIITGSHNELLGWDLRLSKNPIQYYNAQFGNSLDTIFLSDSSTFINSGNLISKDANETNLLAWDFKAAVIMSNQIYKEKYSCPQLCLAPNGKSFFAQSNGNYIAIFSAHSPYKMNKFKRFQGHQVDGYSIGLDITPDGRYLVSGSSDGKLYLYNASSFNLISSSIRPFYQTGYPIVSQSSLSIGGNKKAKCDSDSLAITSVSIHPHVSSTLMVGDVCGRMYHITCVNEADWVQE